MKTAKSTLSEKEINEYLNPLISKHKRLKGGVEFLKTIPKVILMLFHCVSLRFVGKGAIDLAYNYILLYVLFKKGTQWENFTQGAYR